MDINPMNSDLLPNGWIEDPNKPGRVAMQLSEWIRVLDQDEAGYARRCFRFWNGTNGGDQPTIPAGMSKARADVLRYHTQSLTDMTRRKRKVEDLKVISFRATVDLEKQLAFEASELDINKSIYIRACIEAGRPIIKAYPQMINFFADSVIPK
jgi:hypothetical protein